MAGAPGFVRLGSDAIPYPQMVIYRQLIQASLPASRR
jgi:hypothetical protein